MSQITTSQSNFEGVVSGIINELYNDCKDLGKVDTFIPQGLHTADYELNQGHLLRVKEDKGAVYYNILRV